MIPCHYMLAGSTKPKTRQLRKHSQVVCLVPTSEAHAGSVYVY